MVGVAPEDPNLSVPRVAGPSPAIAVASRGTAPPNVRLANVPVRSPGGSLNLFLLSPAASEPMGSYTQMDGYSVKKL